MRSNILTQFTAMIVLVVLGGVVRYALFQYFFAKPISEINGSIAKQLTDAARRVDSYAPAETSTRSAYKTDAEWEKAAFGRPAYIPRHRPAGGDAAAPSPKPPVLPQSAWVEFASSDAEGNRILQARLSLRSAEGTKLLTIELTQKRPAQGDQGGAAHISFAGLTQAGCHDADGLVLRFDDAQPARLETKGVWEDAACRFRVPDFSHFRQSLTNGSMLFVSLAKGDAATAEIAAPVSGLSWVP